MVEKTKHYYTLGLNLGKEISKKGGKLETKYKNLIRNLDTGIFRTPKDKFNELVEIMLMADVYIPNLPELYLSSDKERTTALHLILNACAKAIIENK